MDFHYLRYLASLGTTHLHPHSQVATAILIHQLDLQAGQAVLELGCGTGATLIQIAQQHQGALFGVDVLPEMLAVARKRVRLAGWRRRITLQQVVPGEPLPFAAATFHRVYVESVLGIQTACDLQNLLAEIYRVLQPGGRFIANEAIWVTDTDPAVVEAINSACLRDFGVRQALAEPWGVADWVTALRQTGFQLVSADLLKELKQAYKPNPQPPPLALRLSDWFSQTLFWGSFLSRRQRQVRKQYSALLLQHALDGQHTESRLFVAEKPLSTPSL